MGGCGVRRARGRGLASTQAPHDCGANLGEASRWLFRAGVRISAAICIRCCEASEELDHLTIVESLADQPRGILRVASSSEARQLPNGTSGDDLV
jgi:hypothetical protein